MKIYAVMSPKGGVGKTTTADALAYILAEVYKRRVLVVEADPQADTTKTFHAYEPDGIGMSELLEGKMQAADVIRPTHYEHIDIIPGNGYLTMTDVKLLRESDSDQVRRLKNALEPVAAAYDYCICDCGRLIDMVVLNVLVAADMIIAPVKVGGFEITALDSLREAVEDLKEINPGIKIKALMTIRRKNKTSLEFEDWLKNDSGIDVFVQPIRQSVIAERASIARMPAPAFSKRGIVSRDYAGAAYEIIRADFGGKEDEGNGAL